MTIARARHDRQAVVRLAALECGIPFDAGHERADLPPVPTTPPTVKLSLSLSKLKWVSASGTGVTGLTQPKLPTPIHTRRTGWELGRRSHWRPSFHVTSAPAHLGPGPVGLLLRRRLFGLVAAVGAPPARPPRTPATALGHHSKRSSRPPGPPRRRAACDQSPGSRTASPLTATPTVLRAPGKRSLLQRPRTAPKAPFPRAFPRGCCKSATLPTKPRVPARRPGPRNHGPGQGAVRPHHRRGSTPMGRITVPKVARIQFDSRAPRTRPKGRSGSPAHECEAIQACTATNRSVNKLPRCCGYEIQAQQGPATNARAAAFDPIYGGPPRRRRR